MYDKTKMVTLLMVDGYNNNNSYGFNTGVRKSLTQSHRGELYLSGP
jgi:hypothetical protein